ncbi:hypothetical protein SAMN02799622_05243 [Methylobacterium sp. UNC378MF]|nr:hypothetical protein SAMN02799622_05243 [Methylobacterium sp. UNC378MF]
MIGSFDRGMRPRGPLPIQAPSGADFRIPPPQVLGPQAEQPLKTGRAVDAASPFAGLDRAPTMTEITLGSVALMVLAVIFLFVRQGVRVSLVNRRATLDAAAGASWTLFAALMVTATVLIGATVGRFWQAWAGLTVAFALCAILFAAALALILRAPDRRR